MLFGRKKEEKEKNTVDKIIQYIEQKRQKKDVQKWEYLVVQYWDYQGSDWTVIINGYQAKYNWDDLPRDYDIANQLGELGWELVSTTFDMNGSIKKMLFKCPK